MREQAGNSLATEPAGIDARKAGFAFVARTNRWMIASAVALAAGLSAFTAHAFHARPAAVRRPDAAPSTPPGRARRSTNQNVGAPLQPPSQVPAASDAAPAPVVSGGS
jgi:hypothetical protein